MTLLKKKSPTSPIKNGTNIGPDEFPAGSFLRPGLSIPRKVSLEGRKEVDLRHHWIIRGGQHQQIGQRPFYYFFVVLFFFCWDREWVFCEIATGFVQVLKMGFIEFYRWFSFSLFLLFFHRVGRQTRAVAWLRSKT